ncbi:SAP3-like protein [Mya arenaria]|uniref:SAP3-like protein n=1 Tax=Mya arenaria TaxID=6604 RepID=A0ABY7DQM5_MYAAR|nr:SAP3-like protein [Mya arenaria]
MDLYTTDYAFIYNNLKDITDEIAGYITAPENVENYTSRGPVRLTSFSFKDCGGAGALVNINSLSITPDPVVFPGPLNVATDFKINSPLGQPLKGDLYIAKKVLGKYIKLPCIDNFGSCSYADLCVLLEQVQCPDPIVRIGIDCTCPLKANSYSLPKTEFDVDVSFIPAGDYMARGMGKVSRDHLVDEDEHKQGNQHVVLEGCDDDAEGEYHAYTVHPEKYKLDVQGVDNVVTVKAEAGGHHQAQTMLELQTAEVVDKVLSPKG